MSIINFEVDLATLTINLLHLAKEGILKTLLKMFYDGLKPIAELKEKLKELGGEIEEAAEKAGNELVDLIDEIIRWIRSMDPVRAIATS